MKSGGRRTGITREAALTLTMLLGAFALVAGLLPAINPGLCNVSFLGDSPLAYKIPYAILALAGAFLIAGGYAAQRRSAKADDAGTDVTGTTRSPRN